MCLQLNKHSTKMNANSIIIIVLVMYLCSCDLTVNITCQKCNIACGMTNCMRIVGDDFSGQACPLEPCQLNLTLQMNINTCDTSINQTACQSGLCFYPTAKSGCAYKLYSKQQCSISRVLSQKCTSCLKTVGCQTCNTVSVQYNGTTRIPFQTCLGGSCGGLQGFTATFSPCTTNFGFNCDCCYSYSGSMRGNSGFCTSDAKMFTNYNFTLWAHKKLSQNLELKLTIGGLLGVFLIILVAN